MEKLIYLLWAPQGHDIEQTKERLLGEVAPRLLALGPAKLSMNIDDADAAAPPPVPTPAGEAPLSAEVSVWLDCHDFRGPYEQILAAAADKLAGYLVTESLYTDYGDNHYGAPRDWPDGQRSPGILTVTLLEKPQRLTYEAWIEHWYGTQSPVSAEIQPRMRYVRNAVARPLTPHAPPYLGIVEEAWPSTGHVVDPMLFYCATGSQEKLQANMARMLDSVTAFLDIDRLRNNTMSEYFLKS